jgi:hypothetical protein
MTWILRPPVLVYFVYEYETQNETNLSINFIQISGVWQLIDQEEIHNQCLNDDPKERIKAANQLKDNFSLLPDKQQAWNDLHELITDKNSSVRYQTAS